MAKDGAFWAFFVFGVFTILIAFLGGSYGLIRGGGGGAVGLSALLFFLGASLAVMLGSLLVIRKRETQKNKGG